MGLGISTAERPTREKEIELFLRVPGLVETFSEVLSPSESFFFSSRFLLVMLNSPLLAAVSSDSASWDSAEFLSKIS